VTDEPSGASVDIGFFGPHTIGRSCVCRDEAFANIFEMHHKQQMSWNLARARLACRARAKNQLLHHSRMTGRHAGCNPSMRDGFLDNYAEQLQKLAKHETSR